MDTAHLHLIITHLPIFGSLLGTLVLLYALLTKSEEGKVISYGLLIISALGAGVAYLSGEGAEEKVEGIPGVLENLIEQHEEAAQISLIALIITGIISILSIILTRYKHSAARLVGFITLVIALASFGLVARTGYLGGQIRHTEIRTGAVMQENNTGENNTGENNDQEKGEKDDD